MIRKGLLVLSVLVLTFFVAYYFGNKGKKDQENLLTKLKELSSQKILYVEIIPRTENAKKIKIVDSSQLDRIRQLLANGDKQIIGGHNIQTGDWTLLIKVANGPIEEFFVSSYSEYEFNKNALYFVDPECEDKIASKPVRVPGLKNVLIEDTEKRVE